MRRLVAIAPLIVANLARADDTTLIIQGSSAPSFATKAKEGARPRDTPDAAALLEGLPGLRVRRLGAESSFATLSIRGAASNQVAVLFAGVPLTGGADPSIDLATLPLWPGASARVHRTFAPAFLGGGYLGGVVDLSPVELAGKPRTEIYDAVGSFGALRLRIADVRPISDWKIATGLSANRSEGDFRYFDPVVGRDVERRNAATRQVAGVVQARRDVDAWTILITALATARRDGVGGPFDRPALATTLDRNRLLASLELRRNDDEGRWLFRLWSRSDGRTFEDPLGEQGFFPGVAFDRVFAAGAMLGRSLRFGERLTLDLRLDESAESSSGVRLGAAAPNRERLRLGSSVDVTYRASEALTFVLAGRADLRNDRGVEATTREVLPSAHVGFEQQLGARLAVAGHAGFLARPPSFLELLGDGGVYTPSPNLRSERATAADLGIRASASKHLELEAVLFGSLVRDLIVVAPVGLRSLRAENVGEALIVGGEVSVAATVGPARAVLGYTRLHTEDRTTTAASRGAPLPGRPSHDVTFDLSAKLGPLTLRYGFDLVSTTTLDRPGLRELPTRVFHGAGARLELPSGWSALFEVANLLDRRTVDVLYEGGSSPRFGPYPISDFIGYPLPGRRWSLAVRFTP